MTETVKKFSLSSSALKVIAILTMLIDHIACFLNPIPIFSYELFTIGSKQVTVYYVFRSIGRIAFPLFCFMIGEGYLHTRNRFRYGLALFIGAIVSEIPFNLVFTGTCTCREHQNVFFTLLLGYLGICCYEHFSKEKIRQILSIVVLGVIAYFIKCDYSIRGYGAILLFYILRADRLAVGIVGTLILELRTIPAYVLIAFYNGKRGFIRKPAFKYAFYAFYPVHLFILFLLQCALNYR